METLQKLSEAHICHHCTHFVNQSLTVSKKIKDIDKRILEKNHTLMTQNFLFGEEQLSSTENKLGVY